MKQVISGEESNGRAMTKTLLFMSLAVLWPLYAYDEEVVSIMDCITSSRQRGHCAIIRHDYPAPRATQSSGLATVCALVYLIMNLLSMQNFSDLLLTCSQASLVIPNHHCLKPLSFGSIAALSICTVERDR